MQPANAYIKAVEHKKNKSFSAIIVFLFLEAFSNFNRDGQAAQEVYPRMATPDSNSKMEQLMFAGFFLKNKQRILLYGLVCVRAEWAREARSGSVGQTLRFYHSFAFHHHFSCLLRISSQIHIFLLTLLLWQRARNVFAHLETEQICC